MKLRAIWITFIFVFFTSVFIVACDDSAPSSPACRTDLGAEENISANAACIVVLDGHLLTISHRLSGKYDLPGGGFDQGEPAQCTAHRETWEETGFNVNVKSWLGNTSSGLKIFFCEIDKGAGIHDQNEVFPAPKWASTEVNQIQFVDPFVTQKSEWRYPEQLILIRELFNQAMHQADDE